MADELLKVTDYIKDPEDQLRYRCELQLFVKDVCAAINELKQRMGRFKGDTGLCQEKSDTGLCHMDFGSDCGVRFPKSNGSVLHIEKGKIYDENFEEIK